MHYHQITLKILIYLLKLFYKPINNLDHQYIKYSVNYSIINKELPVVVKRIREFLSESV